MEQDTNLGKLKSTHGVSVAFTQRAFIISAVSFVFFLAMLIAFSFRQSILYFLLGTAFLIVEIFTLAGWYFGRNKALEIYENGFTYKNIMALWEEISLVESDESSHGEAKSRAFTVKKYNGEKIILTESIDGLKEVVANIEKKAATALANPRGTKE